MTQTVIALMIMGNIVMAERKRRKGKVMMVRVMVMMLRIGDMAIVVMMVELVALS